MRDCPWKSVQDESICTIRLAYSFHEHFYNYVKENNYAQHATPSQQQAYPTCNPFTEQSRATHPAWELRDLEQVAWETLPLDPQENTCIPFQNNLSTRILEKDHFVAEVPCLPMDHSTTSISTQPYSGFGNPPNTLCSRNLTCADASIRKK